MAYDRERQFYRMLIPPGDVVTFAAGSHTMPVREISERGIRYDPVAGHSPEPGSAIEGVVRFKTIGDVEVSGKFVRTQGRSIVVVLDSPGIPYAQLMELQLFLRKRYPTR